MKTEKMSIVEFHEKYFKSLSDDGEIYPQLRDADIEFFNMVDKAQKEGKKLLIHRGRGRNWDGYFVSLIKTAMQLTDGNKICLLSKNPEKFVADLKRFFNLDVTIEPSTVNGKIKENSNIISIKLQ